VEKAELVQGKKKEKKKKESYFKKSRGTISVCFTEAS